MKRSRRRQRQGNGRRESRAIGRSSRRGMRTATGVAVAGAALGMARSNL